MPENVSPESEIVLDSRKAKVVAFFAVAPSAALLFFWLWRVTRLLDAADSVDSVDRWVLWPGVSAVLLISAVILIPLYFAIKIWLRPTLGNLRRVPFIAAFWWMIGVPLIYLFLVRFEWISFKDTESGLLVDVGNLLLLLLTLGIFFLVKNAMVLWFKTPELAQPGLQPNNRRALWWLYCFFLWGALNALGTDLVEPFDDYSLFWTLIGIVIFVIAIYVAMSVYKIGLRPLGLRPK